MVARSHPRGKHRGFPARVYNRDAFNGPIIFSPGGDGGLLILPIAKTRGHEIAENIIKSLGIESNNLAEGADAKSRVGIHYGQVSIYTNADGVERPTGRVCLMADAIANGVTESAGVVISEEFTDTVTGGNQRLFKQQYIELSPAKIGSSSVERYARRSAGMNSLPPQPLPQQVPGMLSTREALLDALERLDEDDFIAVVERLGQQVKRKLEDVEGRSKEAGKIVDHCVTQDEVPRLSALIKGGNPNALNL